jgi:hypothetical protein
LEIMLACGAFQSPNTPRISYDALHWIINLSTKIVKPKSKTLGFPKSKDNSQNPRWDSAKGK